MTPETNEVINKVECSSMISNFDGHNKYLLKPATPIKET